MAKKNKKTQEGWHAIGVDLGATKILAAVVDEEGRILGEAKLKTRPEKGPEAVIARIIEVAQQAVSRSSVDWPAVKAVGVGAPGPVDGEAGVIHTAPNMPGWNEVPLAAQLEEALGVPACIENDVNLGTLGEHVLGAGKGTRDMVGIFPGTGIGGGLILDGKLRSGFRCAAGEVGHMVLLADGPVCGCGKRGCAEALASRTAIERDILLALAAGRESVVHSDSVTPAKAGVHPAQEQMDSRPLGGPRSPLGVPSDLRGNDKGERLTSGVLAEAWKAGDPLVTEVLRRVQWYWGLLTADIVNLVDPEMVVYGGGLVEALGDEFLGPVRVTARQYFIQQAGADRVQIVPAKLGDYAVVLGAAMLARGRCGDGTLGHRDADAE